MVTRIYTKTGDSGETGLFGGGRVPKDHLRVEAYGALDELNAHLGQTRAFLPPTAGAIDDILFHLQNLLFELGAELATPPAKNRRPAAISSEDVTWLESRIDEADGELPALKSFILPSGMAAVCALHVARSVCRRAERRLVTLCRAEPQTGSLALVFLNRLGDFLFVLARLLGHRLGQSEVPWLPRDKKAKK